MSTLKRFKSSIVMMIKFALFITLFSIFFLIFGIENAWLLHASRTAAITMLSFAAFGIASMSIYGGYRIGVYKSKPIISSMTLSIFFTDIITYLQLNIMNTNSANNQRFRLENLDLLAIVFILQFIVIVGFTYFGNYIYFIINSTINNLDNFI